MACLLRNLYVGQKATVTTTVWFQIGKGVCQGCILSPCLFKVYAEYIMRNTRLDEAQAGIKIAGRNINNLRYADDTTCWRRNETPTLQSGLNLCILTLASYSCFILYPLHNNIQGKLPSTMIQKLYSAQAQAR